MLVGCWLGVGWVLVGEEKQSRIVTSHPPARVFFFLVSQRDMATAKARHDEAVRQIEQEYEEEITKMRQSFQKDLSEEETKTAQKQGALTSQGNKLESMKKRLLESKQKCTAKEKECDKLNHRILQMQEQMRTMARALEVRDASLLDKEKEIAGLRTENRTLDNFRFVLDHKISKMSSERGAWRAA